MPDDSLDLLTTNLRFHSGWVALCRGYLRRQQKPMVAAFLQRMLAAEIEAVELLAQTLRQHDIAVHPLGVQEELVANGMNRRSVRASLEYINVGLTRSLDWYDERLTHTDDPFLALWSSLRALHSDVSAALGELLAFLDAPADSQSPVT